MALNNYTISWRYIVAKMNLMPFLKGGKKGQKPTKETKKDEKKEKGCK